MKISKEVKVGVVMIVSLAVLFWGLNFLKGNDIFKSRRTFYGKYSSVDGLVTSSKVMVNGLKVGKVTNIFLGKNQSEVIVVFDVDNNELVIPKNTIARLVSEDYFGNKAISLIIGDSTVLAENKDTLTTDAQASLTEEVNKQVLPIKKKAESLISSVDSVVIAFKAVFNPKTNESIRQAITSIQATVKNVETISFGLDTLLGGRNSELAQIVNNIKVVSNNIKKNSFELGEIIKNVTGVTDSLAASSITSTINNANTSLIELESILHKVNNGEGSLGLLINSDSIYNNLAASSANLDKLIKDIKENPSRYVHVSVFGGKNK